MNEATEGFIFSKSELSKHVCRLRKADKDDTSDMCVISTVKFLVNG